MQPKSKFIIGPASKEGLVKWCTGWESTNEQPWSINTCSGTRSIQIRSLSQEEMCVSSRFKVRGNGRFWAPCSKAPGEAAKFTYSRVSCVKQTPKFVNLKQGCIAGRCHDPLFFHTDQWSVQPKGPAALIYISAALFHKFFSAIKELQLKHKHASRAEALSF